MQFQRKDNSYIIRLEKGEEILATLQKFCRTEQIEGGTFVAIGATSKTTIGFLPPNQTDYKKQTFEGAFEVVSLTGIISQERIHTHGVISDENFQTFGGHVFELVASPTLEISLHKFPTLTRAEDPETHLQFLNLPNEF